MNNLPSVIKLNQLGIKYKIHPYPLELRDTTLIAKHIGVEPKRNFKSLALSSKGELSIAMVPSNTRLSHEKLRKESGAKRINIASVAETESLTGLKVGGISPLATLDMSPTVYIDKSIQLHEWITLSAGKRGVAIEISTADLLSILNPVICKITE